MSRVVGIGELKTATEDRAAIQLHMKLIAQSTSSFASVLQSNKRGTDVPTAPLSQVQANRFARQMEQILSAFKKSETRGGSESLSVDKKIDFANLESVLDLPPGGVKYQKNGKGLLLVAVSQAGSISERELRRGNVQWQHRLRAFTSEAAKLVNAGATDNSLIISSMGFSDEHQPIFMPGTIPLFWWPLTQRQKSDLIFGRIVLLSICNPSHYLDVFRHRGYSVVADHKGNLKSATRRLPNGRTIRLENFSFFKRWATHYLLDEEVLDTMIGGLEQRAQAAYVGGGLQMELKPQLVM
jgi:hypothetical protein